MRKYDVFKLDGDRLRFVNRFMNRNKADYYLAYKAEKHTFYIVNYYVDYSEKDGTWTFLSSILFLNGVAVKHSKKKILPKDTEEFKNKLGRVYTTDGKEYYINNRQLTCYDVFKYIGGWGHVKVVQEKPERWAIIYRDVDLRLLGKNKDKLPPLNAQASVKFGMTIYGDVIYINENYC